MDVELEGISVSKSLVRVKNSELNFGLASYLIGRSIERYGSSHSLSIKCDFETDNGVWCGDIDEATFTFSNG